MTQMTVVTQILRLRSFRRSCRLGKRVDDDGVLGMGDARTAHSSRRIIDSLNGHRETVRSYVAERQNDSKVPTGSDVESGTIEPIAPWSTTKCDPNRDFIVPRLVDSLFNISSLDLILRSEWLRRAALGWLI
jgi:hypothetical protein